ncbi:unnamed protein product [Lathyrus oleraceus]
MARQRENGEYVLDASSAVGEKIDLLVKSTREGSFVTEPLHDILVEAIRSKEHGGRVRAVGDDIGMRVFFGTLRKSTRHV